jgi:hypothetical protein
MTEINQPIERTSPKAWMTVRDADLYEGLLRILARRRSGVPIRVVEWGIGRSTLWYPGVLEALKVPYFWLALDHDWSFFESEIRGHLIGRPYTMIVRGDEVSSIRHALTSQARGLCVVVYEAGELWPSVEGRERDREADLDEYVNLAGRLGRTYDLAVIDGRKRRRCLLEAARLLSVDGYAILHDAWRRHYQCAWNAFRSGRRFGDEWWIGSPTETDFTDVLPSHAFEHHHEE